MFFYMRLFLPRILTNFPSASFRPRWRLVRLRPVKWTSRNHLTPLARAHIRRRSHGAILARTSSISFISSIAFGLGLGPIFRLVWPYITIVFRHISGQALRNPAGRLCRSAGRDWSVHAACCNWWKICVSFGINFIFMVPPFAFIPSLLALILGAILQKPKSPKDSNLA